MKKMGVRKEKKLKEETLKLLRTNLGIIQPTLETLGISRYYYDKWLVDPEFKTEVEVIDRIVNDFVESKFLKLISDGDRAAIIFYLKTKMGDKYMERTFNEHIIRPIDFKFGGDDDQKKLGEFGDE